MLLLLTVMSTPSTSTKSASTTDNNNNNNDAMSTTSTTTTATSTSLDEAKGRYLLLHQELVYNKDAPDNLSLPPIDNILKNIESYQNQQQLNDSQLLLEFNQRNNDQSSSSPQPKQTFLQQSQYTFHNPQQRSESTNSIDNFQTELKLEQKPPLPHSLSEPQHKIQHIQRPAPSHSKSTSSTKQQQQNQNRSTTPLSLNTSFNNAMDDIDSRETSVDSGFESPGLTPGGSNKKRTNLPRETIEILNEWILNNMDNPYPNHTQKRILLEQTGLSNVQLSNWFINKRRRRLFSNLSGNNGQPIKKKRLIDRL